MTRKGRIVTFTAVKRQGAANVTHHFRRKRRIAGNLTDGLDSPGRASHRRSHHSANDAWAIPTTAMLRPGRRNAVVNGHPVSLRTRSPDGALASESDKVQRIPDSAGPLLQHTGVSHVAAGIGPDRPVGCCRRWEFAAESELCSTDGLWRRIRVTVIAPPSPALPAVAAAPVSGPVGISETARPSPHRPARTSMPSSDDGRFSTSDRAVSAESGERPRRILRQHVRTGKDLTALTSADASGRIRLLTDGNTILLGKRESCITVVRKPYIV